MAGHEGPVEADTASVSGRALAGSHGPKRGRVAGAKTFRAARQAHVSSALGAQFDARAAPIAPALPITMTARPGLRCVAARSVV